MGNSNKTKVKGHYKFRNGKPVYYREHERKNSGRKSDNGDLNPLAKAIIGGIALFCLAQAGLGWIGDTIQEVKGTAEDIQAVGESVDNVGKTDKNTSEVSLNTQGFTIDFDINDIEASDVQEILQYLHDNLVTDQENITDDNIIYLSTDVFNSNENYKAAVLNRLNTLAEPVIFIITYNKVSESEKESVYSNVVGIVQTNNEVINYRFTDVSIDALYGAPSNNDLTIILRFVTS